MSSSASFTWDASQQAVLDACVPGAVLSVIGAPGTGKSTVLRECVIRACSKPGARIAVLSPDRRSADGLRNKLSLAMGGLGDSVSVQSVAAFAYSIVSIYSQMLGRREPELMSGPEQDALLKEIFDLAAEGILPGIDENALASVGVSLETAQLPAFRAEMRDLITRAAELDLSVSELSELGRRYERPVWEFGATVIDRYEAALATRASASSANPDRVDHARIITRAVHALRTWDKQAVSDGDLAARGGRLAVACPHWDLVIVDDVQNATLGLRTLLSALIEAGSSVVTFGNPDQGVQGYRGGIAQLPRVLTYPRSSGGIGAKLFVLDSVYRGNDSLYRFTSRVSSRIALGPGKNHRHTTHAGVSGKCVQGWIFPNESEELAGIADQIRSLHLRDGVPYSHMAIITRSHSMHQVIREECARFKVPIDTGVSSVPLRDQPAVASLLAIIRLTIDLPQDTDQASSLALCAVSGVYGAIDPRDLRIIARRVSVKARQDGEHWSDRDVWAHFATQPRHPYFAQEQQLKRYVDVQDSIRHTQERGGSASEVLWAAWNALNMADEWRDVAGGVGPRAEQAHGYLDSVIQVFRVAQRLEDRDPRAASISHLLHVLDAQDLPEDSVARSAARDSVALLTPSACIGREWEYVFIIGMADGVWPNTRLRNPLVHVPELVSIVVGGILAGQDVKPSQLRSEVIDDELRMLLHASSRATRALYVSCVENDEQLPSRFIEWLADSPRDSVLPMRTIDRTVRVLGSSSLIGELRQAQRYVGTEFADQAHRYLTKLKDAGVSGADPTWWVDQMSVTCGEAPTHLSISPSRVESMLDCPLKGFFDSVHADDVDDAYKRELGILIHAIAEKYPQGGRDNMKAMLDERWGSLGLLQGTVYEQNERAAAEHMVDVLAAYCESVQGDVLVERTASAFLDGVSVTAKLDRIERNSCDPNYARIVDIKTGSTSPSAAAVAVHPQLLIYQWLLAFGAVEGVPAGVPHDGAHLLYVRKGAPDKPSIYHQQSADSEALDMAERMITAAAHLINAQDFVAVPEYSRCKYCSYCMVCPIKGMEAIFS